MLLDKSLQEGKEINFLTYCSDGQPNWFGKPHTTTFIQLNATGPQELTDSWSLCWTSPNSYWQASPLTMWWQQPCVLLLLLPSMGGGLGQQPRDSSGGKASARAREEGAAVRQDCLTHLLWWKKMTIVECDTYRFGWQNAQSIQFKSWAILVQINGNHHNFTFHTDAMQCFYCAAKAFFSHQHTQDYHRPPRKTIWSTVYSWAADYTDCILNSRMCTGSLCL